MEAFVGKTTIFLDKNVIKPYFTVTGEEFHHVPVHRRAVAVVTLVVALPGRKMDGTENLLVEQNIAHRPGNPGIDTNGKLADIPGSFVRIEDQVELFVHAGSHRPDYP